MKKIKLTIEILSPIVLSATSGATVLTASNDYFSGSILRGIVASQYIGNKKNIHLDSQFRQLFFNKLRFIDAYPVDKSTGKRAIPLPLSLQKYKLNDTILDLITSKPKANYKSIKGLGVVEDNEIIPVEPIKNIRLHMSRTDLQRGDKKESERLAGRSLHGGVYNYETLECDQIFEGYVLGAVEALEALKDNVKDSWECNVGRSRYTQYGLCRITLGEISDVENVNVEADSDNMVYLRLETPMLHWNNIITGADMVLQQVADYMNNARNTKDVFSVKIPEGSDEKYKIFSNIEEQDNFVGIWNMKRPRAIALSAGAIFSLHKNDKWSTDDYQALKKMLWDGVGIRTEEGFGQLRIWNINKMSYKDSVSESNEELTISNKSVKSVAKNILNMRLNQMVRNWAADDAESIRSSIPSSGAHLMSRLDAVAGNKFIKSLIAFRARIDEMTNGNDDRPIRKTLRSIKLNGYTLLMLLTENDISCMPYMDRLVKNLNYGNMLNLYNEVGISNPADDFEIFREYWHCFFRHCRKLANTRGGDN